MTGQSPPRRRQASPVPVASRASGLRRSFRWRLSLRFGITLLLVAAAGSLVGYLALRTLLYDQLDRTLLRLAGIEAAAAADSRDSAVHFHDEVFLSAGPGHEAILARYAQVWSLDGRPVLRTANLGQRNLPLRDDLRERVLATGEGVLFGFRWDGARYRSVLYPLGLVGPQHELHLLQVAASTERVEALLRRFLVFLGFLLLAGTVAGFGSGWWIAGTAIRPVTEVIRQAESIEMTRAERRISAEAETEEMRRLVSVLNAMLGRIEAAFESQRRFLADVGHEIRTPLTVLRGDVEVALRKRRSPEEYEEILRQSLEDLKAVSGLADDLIMLARGESGALTPEIQPVDAAELLRSVAERYRGAAAVAGAAIEARGEPGVIVAGDRALLERALGNLVDNAIKYGGEGNQIALSAVRSDGEVLLRVADRGPGIPEEEQVRLFERFARGKAGRRAARGSGLGLAIVKTIAESLGGAVEVKSTVGDGTTFVLRLPAASPAERPAGAVAAESPAFD